MSRQPSWSTEDTVWLVFVVGLLFLGAAVVFWTFFL